MDRFEQRMQEAAEEVRDTTRNLPRPGVAPVGPARNRRGWLVFAAAFTAVALAFGLLPLLDGGREQAPVGSPSTTVPLEPPTTTLEPPPTTHPEVTCSSQGAPVPGPADGVPDQVADVRQAIIEAAQACDFATLVDLAGDRFTTHFGGGGSEMLQIWEDEGEGKLGVLLAILDMSHAEVEYGDGTRDYVWPAAFAYDHWDDIPQEYLEELLAIYTPAELEQLSGFGSYAGWRTGISDNGEWRFFVAGD